MLACMTVKTKHEYVYRVCPNPIRPVLSKLAGDMTDEQKEHIKLKNFALMVEYSAKLEATIRCFSEEEDDEQAK